MAHTEPVYCLVGSPASAAALHGQGLTTRAVDLDRGAPVLDHDWDQREIFYLAPPPPAGETDPRMQRFLQSLPRDHRHRIVYISTSGVYGNCAGGWVDETRPANPQVDRARRRLSAERQLLAWRTDGGGEVVILRVAGIYGPGKLPLDRLKKGLPMIGADEAPWTNRIHIDDLVQVCAAAMARGRDGEVYNVSDGRPGNMRDYFDRVADLAGLPRAPLIRLAEAGGRLSAGLMSYLGESRRLDNRKMIAELRVQLRYPTLAEGLAACVNDPDEAPSS
jgi:nucleoside-diphosphate-sugar epimerase